MDPQPQRAASPNKTGPLRRAGVPLRAMFLALVVALVPMVTLAASSGQGNALANAAKVSKGITVTLSPSSRTVDQGQSASYTVSATSIGGFTGQVTFAVVGLPSGAAAQWQPSSVALSSGSTAHVTVTVTTSPNTPAGKSDFTLKATSGTTTSGTTTSGTTTSGTTQASVPAQLHVLEAKRNFDVSGSVDGLLAPGVSRPLDLQISNPGNKSIAVANLSVAISQVVRTPTAVAANLPCTTADYKIIQYSGQYPLTVVPGTRSLSALGVSQASWPQLQMLDTTQLQDGCKGATLKLTYSGTGQAN